MPADKGMRMKIAIIGNGAIGNLLAYACQRHALDFCLIERQPLASHRQLRVTDINGQQHTISCPLGHMDTIGAAELVIIPVKAYQVASVINDAKAYLQPRQTLVLLHNGMGTIEQATVALPQQSVIAATTSYGAFKDAPDSLKIMGQGDTHLGWIHQAKHSEVPLIEDTLSALLPPSHWHQDIQLALWLKLAVNASINPLTAIYQVNNGQLAEARFQSEIDFVCAEISLVMQKLGYQQSKAELLSKVNRVIAQTADNLSSMNRDIFYQRPSEIDFINGYILRQAKRLGIACPHNQALYTQIKKLEQAYS